MRKRFTTLLIFGLVALSLFASDANTVTKENLILTLAQDSGKTVMRLAWEKASKIELQGIVDTEAQPAEDENELIPAQEIHPVKLVKAENETLPPAQELPPPEELRPAEEIIPQVIEPAEAEMIEEIVYEPEEMVEEPVIESVEPAEEVAVKPTEELEAEAVSPLVEEAETYTRVKNPELVETEEAETIAEPVEIEENDASTTEAGSVEITDEADATKCDSTQPVAINLYVDTLNLDNGIEEPGKDRIFMLESGLTWDDLALACWLDCLKESDTIQPHTGLFSLRLYYGEQKSDTERLGIEAGFSVYLEEHMEKGFAFEVPVQLTVTFTPGFEKVKFPFSFGFGLMTGFDAGERISYFGPVAHVAAGLEMHPNDSLVLAVTSRLDATMRLLTGESVDSTLELAWTPVTFAIGFMF